MTIVTEYAIGAMTWVVADEATPAVLVEETRAPAPQCGPSRRTKTQEYNEYIHAQMTARYDELVGARRTLGLDVW